MRDPMADDAGADLVDRPPWLPRAQYPFTVRRRDEPGGAVAYVDEGTGPTLLFVHAGLWSFVFRDVITRLRADFRCVTLDFPGFRTGAPDGRRPVDRRPRRCAHHVRDRPRPAGRDRRRP